MTSYTIKAIVSFDNEKEPTEFNFFSEKFNWENLVDSIQSTCSLEPSVLYYYKLSENRVASIENQEQLEELLNGVTQATLRFHGNKDQVKELVFVDDAFGRLNTLVTQHQQVLQSNGHLARRIGILASMIAIAETGETFEHEFDVLEKMMDEEAENDKEPERSGDNPRQSFFGRGGPYFGRRGDYHHRGCVIGMYGPFNRAGGFPGYIREDSFGMGTPFEHAGSFHRGRGGCHSQGRGDFGGIARRGPFGGFNFSRMRGCSFEGAEEFFSRGIGRRGPFGGPIFSGVHDGPFDGVDSAYEKDVKVSFRKEFEKSHRRSHHHDFPERGFPFA